jgi:hypothetical protein
MLVTKISPISGENTMDLDITEEMIADWRGGALIQDVMPHLTNEEREFLITGYTPEDWESIFGDDE